MRKILIAATNSNCGKTIFTMGLLRFFKRKGIKVQPYKCGPDYIDPMFHKQACGEESVNLDLVMSSEDHVKKIFSHYSENSDICVVEGVMGLYDGREKWHGSCSEIASLLDLPVILLVNAKSTAYSIAPLLYGFKHFSPKSNEDAKSHLIANNILGVVFNMVGSERHYSILKQACEDVGVECLGYMKRNEKLQIASRHLGLSISEMENLEDLINTAADEIVEHVNLERICGF